MVNEALRTARSMENKKGDRSSKTKAPASFRLTGAKSCIASVLIGSTDIQAEPSSRVNRGRPKDMLVS